MEPTTGSTTVESSPSVSMEAKLMLSSSHADCQKLKDLLSKESATPMAAVMAFISKGNEPSCSAAGAKPPAVAMDAKLMVSRDHGECQELKNLLNKKDATITMVMTTASCAQDSKAKRSLNSSELRLLAAASEGDLEGLKALLGRTSPGIAANINEGMIPVEQVEEGINVASSPLKIVTSTEGDTKCNEVIIPVEQQDANVAEPSAASSLLKVVTMEGDSALLFLAANGANGDGEKVEGCAKFIHNQGKSLLYKKNNKGDTPLHCAVRAGKSKLVSSLTDLAKKDGKVQDLLRMLNNNDETALHEAVCRGDKVVVKELMRADPELASFPTNGVSPLYLAIQLTDDTTILQKEDTAEDKADKSLRKEKKNDLSRKNEEKSMAQTLHDESKDGFLSYLGPNGQNALHAAVLRGPVLTRKLLRWNEDLNKRWNKDLIIQRDGNGSTPLHFAAGLLEVSNRRESVCSILLEANTDAMYQLDNDGLSPIHIAASVGRFLTIALFLEKCPGSAGLRDAKGRTFLHVAVEKKMVWTVYYVSMHPLIAWINFRQKCMNLSQQAWVMNIQDNDGNTALHLAVKAGSLIMFSALFANRNVDLNITNAKGQTPLDIAWYSIPPGLFYGQNSEARILEALTDAGARGGTSREDHFRENHQDIHGLRSEYEQKELENTKDLTQTGSITSVLIATVAFGVIFALPGGYRADDHTNGGTPTLAGRYAFDAFMMADTLAFIFSAATVLCFGRSSSPMINRGSRIRYLIRAFDFMEFSITCFIAAFALGVFVVLSPVDHKTAIAICVMSPLVVLCNGAEFWLKRLLLVPSFWVRKGLLCTTYKYIKIAVMDTLYVFWPLLLIFIWAAYGRTHPISKVEPPSA